MVPYVRLPLLGIILFPHFSAVPQSPLCAARSPPAPVNLFRKAVKDVTLSDGTRIPKGTLVAAAAITAHSDDARYTDPLVFDPFRFARMREGGVGEGVLRLGGGESVKSVEDERIIRRELSKADPSAVVFSESWAAKKVGRVYGLRVRVC